MRKAETVNGKTSKLKSEDASEVTLGFSSTTACT